MQLTSFNRFVRNVVKEGQKFEKLDITGKLATKNRFTDTQKISFLIGLISLIILPNGFSNDFAGYAISFLGIFIGLFSSIVIAMYDKRSSLLEDFKSKSSIEQAALLKIKNYLLQFTAMTSYSILLALVLIPLLSLVLLIEPIKKNIWDFNLNYIFSDFTWRKIFKGFELLVIVCHRFFTSYLLIRFLAITIFSITSYFSFLLSQYKNIKLKDD